MCGSGIGTFIFAPLTEYLLSVYNWKGAMVVIAGLVLHGAVAGALFKPINKSMCSNLKVTSRESLFVCAIYLGF